MDLSGTKRITSDATREALLAAMGFDASGEVAAGAELERLERRERERLLPPARVVRESRARTPRLSLRLPEEADAPGSWRLELVREDGSESGAEGALRRGGGGGTLALPLPSPLRAGYHRVRLEVESGPETRRAEQLLIVAPGACSDPVELARGRRPFGVVANLYTLRSRRNWGAGDLTDLRDLVRWCGRIGADFVGVNPLHALRNRGWEISPYDPVTRLYRNVLYLDAEAIPELAESAEARDRIASPGFGEALERLRASEHVRYEAVTGLKRPVLEALHRAFAERHRGRATARGRAYAAYLEREGEALDDFATFAALEEHFARATPAGWRAWPAAFREPRSAEVRAFREERIEEVDFHRWLQFELDRQLAAAAEEARAGEMALGVYQDLAVGTSAGGSDPWAFPGLFVEGASLGAPPDDFSPEGQNWGLPPIDPRRLAADTYRYWIRLLRGAFAHAGALRIDHVMGLVRQFWIPAGHPGSEGAYVRYPADDLIGILALESRRHGAAVVGEDLGTVPEGLRPALARRGILSSRVLYFERDDEGGFLPSQRYPPRALVTANTHDLPPLAGFWLGRDLELRRAAGHIPSDEGLREAQRRRANDRAALLRRLESEGCLERTPAAPECPADAGAVPAPCPDALPLADLCAAVNAFLCRTPSALAGIALDDLARETDPVNLPGVPLERYPSWSRRMRLGLEELPSDPAARRALEGTRGRGGAPDGA